MPESSKNSIKLVCSQHLLKKRNPFYYFNRATIGLPNGSTMDLELFDNGALADTNSDDGVYARFFTSPTAVNRYSVVCTAWNDGNVYTSQNDSSEVLLPDFSRMEGGGSVRVSSRLFKFMAVS